MKLLYAVAWVALTALVSAETAKLVPLEVAQEADGARYQFVYAGAEQPGGPMVIYRFDRQAGDMLRIEVSKVDYDAATERPSLRVVEHINLLTRENEIGVLTGEIPAYNAWQAAQSSAP